MNTWSSTDKSTWRLLVLFISLATLLMLPYLLGYLTAVPGLTFTGLLMNPEDSQTYLGKILQGYDGRWLYTIPFTPEPHAAAPVGIFYVWLGQLARGLGVTPLQIWHGARVVAQFLLWWATWRFVRSFLPQSNEAWTAYLLALFGSGWGWLLFLTGQTYWLETFPVDFKQPEAHLFFMSLTFPHIMVGTAVLLALVWIWGQLPQAEGKRGWWLAVVSGGANLALGVAYPFLIYLAAAIAGLVYLAACGRARAVQWGLAAQFALAFLIPLPLLAVYAYTLQSNSVFHAWDVQAATPSPPWPHYLVAFGPLLLLAGFYAWRRPTEQRSWWVLWLWVLAAALLLYAPLNAQRRFVQGVHVPLSILSTLGLTRVILPWLAQTHLWQAVVRHPRYSTPGLGRLVTAVFLLTMSLSNIYVLSSVSVSAVWQQPDPLFRPTEEIEATIWLRTHGHRTAVVLSEYETGNYVASHAGQRVVVGHWAETMAFAQKQAEVAQFYAAETADSWRQELLAHYQVEYVWHGPRERNLGGFEPQTAVYLRPIYQNQTITIYQVNR